MLASDSMRTQFTSFHYLNNFPYSISHCSPYIRYETNATFRHIFRSPFTKTHRCLLSEWRHWSIKHVRNSPLILPLSCPFWNSRKIQKKPMPMLTPFLSLSASPQFAFKLFFIAFHSLDFEIWMWFLDRKFMHSPVIRFLIIK